MNYLSNFLSLLSQVNPGIFEQFKHLLTMDFPAGQVRLIISAGEKVFSFEEIGALHAIWHRFASDQISDKKMHLIIDGTKTVRAFQSGGVWRTQ